MSVKMKFGSKDIPFVYKGDKLIYPNPIKDGLLLWYDFKGMRNTDTAKEVAKDLSGNGNDGALTNFNFTEGSGYKDNTLVFDGVDDNLTIPELVLDETAMAVMHDGKIYSYEDDKVLTVGEDGEIVGSGINYILDGFERVIEARTEGASARFNYSTFNFSHTLENMQEYILTADIEITSGNPDNVTVLSRTEDREVNLTVGNLPIINGKIQKTFISNGLDKMIYVYAGASGATEGIGLIVRNLSISKVYEENLLRYSPAPKDYKSVTLSPTSLTSLQLYNKTLNKTELLHNAESKGLKKLKPGVVVQDGLVLHYDFSHESNTSEYKDKAFDYSGNGNHGALQNFGYTEGSGYEGGKLIFDGVDDNIKTPPKLLGGLNSITISLTMKIIAKVDRNDGFMMMGTGTGRVWIRVVGNQLSGNTYFGQSGLDFSTVFTNNALEAGVMSLAFVLDRKGKQTAYLNGTLISERDISEAAGIPTHTGETILGSTSVGYSQPNAEYYDFKIYHKALSPEEIKHNYQIEKEKFNIE